MEEDLPFQAEYAKSDRSSCKACKNLISRDTLRLGIMVQSSHFDGKIPVWHHRDCFFKKAKVKTIADIKHFDQLRWEDQQKIKDAVEGKASATGGRSNPASAAAARLDDYAVEHAKSGKSKCRVCDANIEKNAVRLSVKDYDSQRAAMYGPQDRWHHVDCFVKSFDELIEDPGSFDVTKITGFSSLTDDEKNDLKTKLKSTTATKKRKANSAAAGEPAPKKSKEDENLEKELKVQNDLLWKFRDELSEAVNKNALIGLLEYNSQSVPKGESSLLERVADAMVFGTLSKCPECGGQMVYLGGQYQCSGMATEWTKCLYTSREVKRDKFKIPKEYCDVDFLKKYKYVARTRLLPKQEAASNNNNSAAAGTGKKATDLPLANMKVVVSSGPFASKKTKKQLEEQIKKLGGTVAKKVDRSTLAVVTTKAEVDAIDKPSNKVIAQARDADVHVVSEEFLDAVGKGGATLLVGTHALATWGSDPMVRTAPPKSKSALSKEDKLDNRFKSGASLMKMKVKGGAAVDPDSGLEDTAHILSDPTNKEPLNAVLGMVDLVRGNNSYYKLQALESDKQKDRYWVFRSWGRIGTTIGGTKTEQFRSAANAYEHFKELYLEKTGWSWEDKKNAVKQANKFFPLELDYGEESEDVKSFDLSTSSSSTLHLSVQELIRFIFDIESMKQVMLEFEIDLKKMPLGKLSRNQIEKAYTVLSELSNLLQVSNGTGNKALILDASTRFYTLIPHDFGMRTPPLLDSSPVIKAKTEMLDNLLEIEVAYSMMKQTAGTDPMDSHYSKLNSDIKPLDKSSEEYSRLVAYVDNTHAATHSGYKLEVADIFEIERQGEESKYRPFRKIHNRMLLWHGSRRTNWAGILSQGLRIAPPEAPVTGYMFGKGIYFADMVSKSANYCYATRSNPQALLLLCEVTLGNMDERTGASAAALKPSQHSCKGVGGTMPDPAGYHTTPTGLVYPMGKQTKSSSNSSLLYNEYIVYDVAQVKQKYLVKVNFVYK